MAKTSIDPEMLDELLKGRDPGAVISSKGLLFGEYVATVRSLQQRHPANMLAHVTVVVRFHFL